MGGVESWTGRGSDTNDIWNFQKMNNKNQIYYTAIKKPNILHSHSFFFKTDTKTNKYIYHQLLFIFYFADLQRTDNIFQPFALLLIRNVHI